MNKTCTSKIDEHGDGKSKKKMLSQSQFEEKHEYIKETAMSMRGQIISKEYQKMVFVQDKDGKEFSCYLDDVKDFDRKKGLSREQRAKCLDISLVAGDSW